MPKGEYTAFMEYKEMRDKYDRMQSFRVIKHEGAFTGLAFEQGRIEGLRADQVKADIRYSQTDS